MQKSPTKKIEIKIIQDHPKENVGSLLKLFNSPYFTLDMAMTYLYKKRNVKGVHDFLVNKFYSYKDHEVDFYIPQLCYMLIKTKAPTLERFILDKCTSNITLFLKIHWCLKAYGQAERKNKKAYEYVDSLIKKTQAAMTQCSAIPKRLSLGATDENENKKSQYLKDTFSFVDILTAISLKLKTLKPEDRKPVLKEYVKRLNKWINRIRQLHKNDEDPYFRELFYGVHLPFRSLSEDRSTQIVRILEDEVACFNTKKRAPYKIVVETIDMREVHETEPREELPPLNPDEPEDNFEDILSEQANWEKSRNKEESTIRPSLDKNKYNALVDFNKIIEEQAKLAGDISLKDESFAQKLAPDSIVQLSTQPHHQIEEEKKGDLETHLKSIEESKKELEEDQEELYDEERHKQNLKKFATVFPQRATPTRRNSVIPLTEVSDDTFEKPTLNKRPSLQYLSEDENIKLVETFVRSLNDDQQEKAEKILHALTEKYNSTVSPEKRRRRKGRGKTTLRQSKYRKVGWGVWDELWEYKKELIRATSPFGNFKSYKLRSIIVKAADDLRQELIAMQLIQKFEQIWKEAGLSLRVRSYDILVTSDDSGIIECVVDTYSIDGVKKKAKKYLRQFFLDTYGFSFGEAQKNFMDSLAAYCLICYFLQIKDRHNGNILLDAYGNIVHIDFGFIFSISPGAINFESAPFKLTKEYAELMGGYGSDTFTYFKLQLLKGFLELRKHVDQFVIMLQVMTEGSDLPCFENFDINVFRERFKESATDAEAMEYIDRLVDLSYDNWRTFQYDNFQKYTNGIMP